VRRARSEVKGELHPHRAERDSSIPQRVPPGWPVLHDLEEGTSAPRLMASKSEQTKARTMISAMRGR